MIFTFIKMSGIWYGMEFDDFEDAQENTQEHINSGNIVCISDDKEYFAEEMNIEEDNIIWVDK